MDEGGRRSTLQLHLRAARAAREAGDLEQARASLDAALAIDPVFTVARLMRESLGESAGADLPPAAVKPTAGKPDANKPDATSKADTVKPTEPPTVASADHYGLREAREERWRTDHRIGLARTAMGSPRFTEATAALDELVELDPTLPAVPETAAELVAAQTSVQRPRLSLPVVAASAVVGIALGLVIGIALGFVIGTRPYAAAESTQTARTEYATGPTAQPDTPARPETNTPGEATAPAVVTSPVRPPFTDGDRAARDRVTPPPARDVTPNEGIPPSLAIVEPQRPPAPAASPAPVSRDVESRVTWPPAAAEAAAASVPFTAATSVPASNETTLIWDTLQRYRRAYNGLDARLAHAVYPGVDETALAYEFETLRSQSLEFESCSLDAQRDSARAVCRGSARSVPKVGSRLPRAERLVWAFRLKKDNGDWTITSAWTDR